MVGELFTGNKTTLRTDRTFGSSFIRSWNLDGTMYRQMLSSNNTFVFIAEENGPMAAGMSGTPRPATIS